MFSPFTLASKTFLNPLPIELIDFSARCVKEGVELKWSTASEKNNDHFVIERSADAINWQEVKTVNSKGDGAGVKQYSCIDSYFSDDALYYRLSQVDKDKSKTIYRTISSVCRPELNEFRFYPNPAANEISVVFNVSQNSSQWNAYHHR